MGWLIRSVLKVIVIGLVVFLSTQFITGLEVDSIQAAILLSFVLGVLNTLVRPLLVLITLPISIITLGLFSFVINALLFWLAGEFVDGVNIDGILPALLGSLVVSLVSWLFDKLFNR